MDPQVWLAILSSSLLSGIVGALVAGLYNMRVKQAEYLNDYYRNIVAHRMSAYEQLEELTGWLRTAVVDNDNRPYHILFSNDEDWHTAYEQIYKVTSKALWLSDAAFSKARELNMLLHQFNKDAKGAIQFGKENYVAIAGLRSSLEKVMADDMLTLHDVRRFLINKKKSTVGFLPLPPQG